MAATCSAWQGCVTLSLMGSYGTVRPFVVITIIVTRVFVVVITIIVTRVPIVLRIIIVTRVLVVIIIILVTRVSVH
jgi:hypothetical protein